MRGTDELEGEGGTEGGGRGGACGAHGERKVREERVLETRRKRS